MFFQTAITLPISRMKALISLLETVEIQTKEKWMTDADILSLRLAPDMLPFVKQIQIVSDNAKWMASRLAGKDIPKYEDTESTLAELRLRLETTISYLDTFLATDFVHAATAEARFPYFPGMHMVGADYVIGYGIPNFFFHVVTAYDILRQYGFDIGKADYMGKEVPLIADAK